MWVIRIDDWADSPGPEVVGGKAVGLRRLIEAGFQVPRGYVVTVDAYRHALRRALLGLTTPEQMHKAILDCEIPVEIVRAIHDAHTDLFQDSVVAVRSSATEEDAERHSFAGQLDSVLNVSGAEEVIASIKSVWASFFSQASLLYRGHVRLDDPPSWLAVVVQEMLKPRAAGVMFTSDPVGRDPNRLVISATEGLGEAVVSGVSAETVYVDLTDRHVIQHVPASPSADTVLTDDDIAELVTAGFRINQLFDAPQDLEWALTDSGLSFLQCRPITTGKASDDPVVWSNVNVGEALPGVGTPMTWSIIRAFSQLGFEKAFGALGLSVPPESELFTSVRGRIYLNLTEFASIMSQIPFMKIGNVLAVGGGGEAETVEQIGYKKRSKVGFLTRLPVTGSRMALSQLSMPLRARRWSKHFKRSRDRYFAKNLQNFSHEELLRQLRIIDNLFNKTGVVMLACGSNFLSSYIATSQLLSRWGGVEAAAKERHLFSGLQRVASAEPGLELLDMSRYVRNHPSLEAVFQNTKTEELLQQLAESASGRRLLQRLDQFLDEYGNRGPNEAELATVRWRERPDFLLDVIRSHLKAPYLPSSEDLERERVRERRQTTEMIRQYFRPGLGIAFRRILAHTQENSRLREELRSCVTDTLSMYRHFFCEVGRRLASDRVIAQVEDIFYLTKTEVINYLGNGAGAMEMALLVGTRRAMHVAFSKAPPPPDTFVLGFDQRFPETKPLVPRHTLCLSGLPASPGRFTGHARVICDLTEEPHLLPGEILVARFTDVGWTPLFLVAGGVVTDMGGPLSHAAVVAREYGVPAVVNTKEATALIQTGDLITIDGDSGEVFLKRQG